MAQAPYQNADGLQVKTPYYYKDAGNFVNRPRYLSTDGLVKELVIDVDLSKITAGTVTYTADLNNDGTNDGFSLGDTGLPAYASVIRAVYFTTEAAVGGTSITVGTYALTGAAVTATGLVTATEGVIANLDTVGARVYGAGALVSTTAETASVGANDVYIGIAATGTFTAGKGRLLISYVDPLGDS